MDSWEPFNKIDWGNLPGENGQMLSGVIKAMANAPQDTDEGRVMSYLGNLALGNHGNTQQRVNVPLAYYSGMPASSIPQDGLLKRFSSDTQQPTFSNGQLPDAYK